MLPKKGTLKTGTDYEVGYAKPPEATQFSPGKSGNPAGRPVGSKNRPMPHEERLKSILFEEAYREVVVNDGDATVSVPMARAIIRSLAVNAAKGNHRSQRLFTELMVSTETDYRVAHVDYLNTVMSYKVYWEEELARREHLGISGPDPVPHPDHLEVNFHTGEVKCNGPFTREEKRKYERLTQIKKDHQEELQELHYERRRTRSERVKAILDEQIEHCEGVLNIIKRVIKD